MRGVVAAKCSFLKVLKSVNTESKGPQNHKAINCVPLPHLASMPSKSTRSTHEVVEAPDGKQITLVYSTKRQRTEQLKALTEKYVKRELAETAAKNLPLKKRKSSADLPTLEESFKNKRVHFDASADMQLCGRPGCKNDHEHIWWCDHCKTYVCHDHMDPDSIPATLQAYELCKHCRLTLHECNACGAFQTEDDMYTYGCISEGCENQLTEQIKALLSE